MASLLLPRAYMSASDKVIDLTAYRKPPEDEQDTTINALWDRLVALTEDAWTWRDAACIAALQQSVDVLKHTIAEEWSKGEDAAVRGVVRVGIR